MQNILSKENVLIKDDLIETLDANFFSDTNLTLTDKSFDILSESGIKLFKNKKKRENILSPEDIPYKELFFSESEMK